MMIATAIAILLLALSDSGCGEREGSWSEENLVTCVRGYPALLGDYGPIHSRFSILNVGKSVDTGYWPGGEASNFTAFLVPKPTPPPSETGVETVSITARASVALASTSTAPESRPSLSALARLYGLDDNEDVLVVRMGARRLLATASRTRSKKPAASKAPPAASKSSKASRSNTPVVSGSPTPGPSITPTSAQSPSDTPTSSPSLTASSSLTPTVTPSPSTIPLISPSVVAIIACGSVVAALCMCLCAGLLWKHLNNKAEASAAAYELEKEKQEAKAALAMSANTGSSVTLADSGVITHTMPLARAKSLSSRRSFTRLKRAGRGSERLKLLSLVDADDDSGAWDDGAIVVPRRAQTSSHHSSANKTIQELIAIVNDLTARVDGAAAVPSKSKQRTTHDLPEVVDRDHDMDALGNPLSSRHIRSVSPIGHRRAGSEEEDNDVGKSVSKRDLRGADEKALMDVSYAIYHEMKRRAKKLKKASGTLSSPRSRSASATRHSHGHEEERRRRRKRRSSTRVSLPPPVSDTDAAMITPAATVAPVYTVVTAPPIPPSPTRIIPLSASRVLSPSPSASIVSYKSPKSQAVTTLPPFWIQDDRTKVGGGGGVSLSAAAMQRLAPASRSGTSTIRIAPPVSVPGAYRLK